MFGKLYGVISRNKYYALFYIICSFFAFIIQHGGRGIGSKKILLVSCVLTALVYFFYKGKKYISIFLAISTLGITLSVITPVLDTPDEQVHLSRAMNIARGNINLDNQEEHLLISQDYFEIYKNFKKPLNQIDLFTKKSSEKLVSFNGETDFRQTNAYWFIGYIPQALGLVIGKIFHLNLGLMFYLGRALNVLAYALLAVIAIKLSGKYKQLMLLIAMLPMNLFLAASYNQDGVSLGIIYLLIGLFIHYLNREKKIGYADVGLFTILLMVTATTKLPYILLGLLLLFIPRSRWKSKGVQYSSIGAVLSIFIVAILWFSLYQQIHPIHLRTGVQISVTEQIRFILSNPIKGFGAVLIEMALSPFKSAMLFNFGWLDLIFDKLYVLYIVLITVSILSNLEKTDFSKRMLWGLGIVSLLIVGIISLSLYLTWTAVGLGIVEGVQGRYYLGVYLLWTILFSSFPNTYGLKNKLSDEFLFKMNVLGLSMFIFLMLGTFY